MPPIGAMLAAAALFLGACTGTTDSPAASPAAALSPESEPTVSSAYAETAQAIFDDLAERLLRAAEVLERADAGSEEWRAEAREVLDHLRMHHEETEQLGAPDGFEESHETLFAATSRIARGAELLAEGIEQQDPDLLEAAAEEILQSVAALEEARLALEEARA